MHEHIAQTLYGKPCASLNFLDNTMVRIIAHDFTIGDWKDKNPTRPNLVAFLRSHTYTGYKDEDYPEILGKTR